MKPIQTKYSNRIFKLPGGTEENDLPLEQTTDEDNNTILISTWELSDTELDDIEATGKIQLVVWGVGTPPVSLRVVTPSEESDLVG